MDPIARSQISSPDKRNDLGRIFHRSQQLAKADTYNPLGIDRHRFDPWYNANRRSSYFPGNKNDLTDLRGAR